MRGPVDGFIAAQPDRLAGLLQATRAFLHDSVPGLTEALKWRMPTFMQGRNLFYLNPQGDHVVLGFSAGASLKEHAHVFDHLGTEVAHVRVRSVADLARPGLREAVRAAAGFPTVEFGERLREHAPHGADGPKVRA